jgi:hypothetical protein
MLRVIEAHLQSRQVSHVVYGTIIGLSLVIGLEQHPPKPGVVISTLLGTAIAVGFAELYSQIVGAETRTRGHVDRAFVRSVSRNVAAVVFGVSFPAVFFVLAAAGAMETDTAFDVAKWSGLGLTGFYGYCGARLAGKRALVALLYAAAIALIGAFLIALKALVH